MLYVLFSADAVNLRREIISPNGLIAELCGNAFAHCGCCGRVAVWQARKKRLKHEARVNGNMAIGLLKERFVRLVAEEDDVAKGRCSGGSTWSGTSCRCAS